MVVVRLRFGRHIHEAVAADTDERVDLWTLRALTIAVKASARRCTG
jgi:hypothetical protein